MNLNPINQTNLYGLDKYLLELTNLYQKKLLPNKILLSGLRGLGKSTLAYHLVNFVLSKNEDDSYDLKNLKINEKNKSFKLILNKSNPNFDLIDIEDDKKMIDVLQIRNLISKLNKSSFNNKPRFILIDNIDYLNTSSINALLKILEEPSDNIFFILINNNKTVLSTLISRCLNFKIYLSNKEVKNVSQKLFNISIDKIINQDLLSYYFTPGDLYNLIKLTKINKLDLSDMNLKKILSFLIEQKFYKKNNQIKHIIFDFIELYFRNYMSIASINKYLGYSYFLRKFYNAKNFNLDEEIIFTEFQNMVLDG